MSDSCNLEDSVKINEYDDEFVKQVKVDTIINKCSKKFSTVIVTKLIGTGSFGKVYLANADYENKNIGIAIKYIHTVSNVSDYDMDDEYSVFKKMSDLGLSPQLYEGIDFETNEGKENKILIMEKFDIDCHTLFVRDGYTFALKKQILSDIVELVTKTVKAGISCIDMKLGNFMYKQEGQVVKMIDFGEYCSCTDKAKGKLMYDKFKFIELCKNFFPDIEEDTPEENKNAFQICEIVFNLIIIKHIMFNTQILVFLTYYYDYKEDEKQYTLKKILDEELQKKRNKVYYEICLLNRHILQLPIMKVFLGTPKYMCYFMAFIYPNHHPLAYIRNKVLTHYCREALGYTDRDPVRQYNKNDIQKILMLNGLDDSVYAKNVKVFMDYGKKEFKNYVQKNIKPGKRSPPPSSSSSSKKRKKN